MSDKSAGIIEFDVFLFEELKKAYAEAVQRGDETFELHGAVLLVGYTKHLIEYLNLMFGENDNEPQER